MLKLKIKHLWMLRLKFVDSAPFHLKAGKVSHIGSTKTSPYLQYHTFSSSSPALSRLGMEEEMEDYLLQSMFTIRKIQASQVLGVLIRFLSEVGWRTSLSLGVLYILVGYRLKAWESELAFDGQYSKSSRSTQDLMLVLLELFTFPVAADMVLLIRHQKARVLEQSINIVSQPISGSPAPAPRVTKRVRLFKVCCKSGFLNSSCHVIRVLSTANELDEVVALYTSFEANNSHGGCAHEVSQPYAGSFD
ncbi:hypothetical protein L6452_18981 [Arctium lappa]|uniref:Uncharacterized protein n=1 Tax=Arctium lappa TaxID=4217 RepID=A0ACB9B6Y7_ARCLA|nr:hypothetical protein L6452_18981 [Arctium lappa]